jgi:peptidoglycan/xylan/chitin deacetylase (PgdA/CDA1 family)
MHPNDPKISCLMVTQDRFEFLKYSVQRFCTQTYPNKELVIVLDGNQESRQKIIQYVTDLHRPEIKIVDTEEKRPLGALRNISMSHATGAVLCQWDDDDLYHPRRLELQYQCLVRNNTAACLLADYLHYFPAYKELYWSDFSVAGGCPGSIMFRAGLGLSYPETGPTAQRGEDMAFQKQLFARHKVVLLQGHGFLYVYIFHGANTWDLDHHARLAAKFSLPFSFVQARLEVLQAQLPVQMEKEFPFTLVCLHEQGIRGTFFVIGSQAAAFPDLLARLRDLGHLVANHTFNHPRLPLLVEKKEILIEELVKTDELIQPYGCDQVFLFRPPFGVWNSEVASVLNQSERLKHYLGPIHWDIDGKDWWFWKNDRSVQECARNYLNLISRRDHGIVLLHDGSAEEAMRAKNQTLDLTKAIVPVLKGAGFQFVRGDEIPDVICGGA